MPLLSTLPKGGAKLLCQRYKNSNWMDFQALARLHPFRAHFTETGALWPLVGYAGSQTG